MSQYLCWHNAPEWAVKFLVKSQAVEKSGFPQYTDKVNICSKKYFLNNFHRNFSK